ncbi:MAG: hypothetical protein GY796_10080 [Chloroflexi bacterium]|nr:hypothetical protein [Chloroflexota bacterium]
MGTWQASYGTASVDTLTIKADDTYQQVFTKSGGESGDYYWESGWNKWWMEEDPSGCVYVHFEGMRYYGDSDDGTLAMTFYDTCNDKSFRMHNSVTLRVEINVTYRIEDMYPNIVLAHLELDPDSLTDMFRPISTPVPGP